MKTACAPLGLAVLMAFAGAALAASPEPPPGAMSCSGCHATGAAVPSSVPRLPGRPAPETRAAMRGFKEGTLPATVMDRIAKGFTDDEIAAIAEWYARQK